MWCMDTVRLRLQEPDQGRGRAAPAHQGGAGQSWSVSDQQCNQGMAQETVIVPNFIFIALTVFGWLDPKNWVFPLTWEVTFTTAKAVPSSAVIASIIAQHDVEMYVAHLQHDELEFVTCHRVECLCKINKAHTRTVVVGVLWAYA